MISWSNYSMSAWSNSVKLSVAISQKDSWRVCLEETNYDLFCILNIFIIFSILYEFLLEMDNSTYYPDKNHNVSYIKSRLMSSTNLFTRLDTVSSKFR